MAQGMRQTACAGIHDLDDSNGGYIVHQVSKLDTLAGVAIKYGVEVADVKRSNGLVTDFQMFAHKTLRIPVGRRHPVASTSFKPENSSLSGCPLALRNGYIQLDAEKTHEKKARDKRPLSSAMNLLRGYYGLPLPAAQADEMASYKPEIEEHSDDELFPSLVAISYSLKTSHRRSNGAHHSRDDVREMNGKTSELNTQSLEAEVVQASVAVDASSERSVRRRFKPDMINPFAETCNNIEDKQDTSIPDRRLLVSGLLGGAESPGGLPLAGAKGKESPILKVRKSSSTSNLQEQTSPQVNIGAQKYGLKVDVKSGIPLHQGVTKNLCDLPPKVINYRFKAALD
ncbi:hypothetical protein GOP47_0022012 [Adiantum capillus-veneris]|uniref:LysM domain-containing protein n=1 Tax=Adiantum capillus-veneris TaxID=13818 RepID=A0A9D4U962_ADICA|nr:hypothetical protein GOP47_0022012 [Adiantum capillus-veneris]